MKLLHPSALARNEWGTALKNASRKTGNANRLNAEQLEIIKEQGWFKMLVPEIYSGLAMSLPDVVRIEECLSCINGSVGWVVTLCSGAGWFGGFLNSNKAIKVFSERNACLAGSGAPSGTAEITSNGILINGKWKYASGAYHATHFTANCRMIKDNKPVCDRDGNQLIQSFIFNAADVTIIPSWHSMGLTATGSESFEVKNLLVSEKNSFIIEPAQAIIKSPLYRYPFLPLAEATTAVNISGMAWHFIDLCDQLFEEKKQSDRLSLTNRLMLDGALDLAKQTIDAARSEFYEIIERSWEALLNHSADQQLYSAVGVKSRHLAHTALICVDRLYPYCGLTAADINSEINQVWRDIHTASQHALLTW